ncbi:MAG: hypothetical protein IJZ53_01900 [Tyzzerella sp.]|nr:hypothetical protein [Tyzzerella sp.]
MNTLKMNHRGTVQLIAHRGVCDLERENTAAAFMAAGNRSYFGIETDIHETADGKFIIIHDDTTTRVAGCDYRVEETDFDTLRSLKLFDQGSEAKRADLVLPTLEEYISICKRYEKVAVLELKNEMKAETILKIAGVIEEMDYLASTIFISFSLNNLVTLREAYPQQQAQYLVHKIENMTELLATLKKYHFDIDAKYTCMTKELVEEFHRNGIKVNVWTVNKVEAAEELEEIGIDYITTNIIE